MSKSIGEYWKTTVLHVDLPDLLSLTKDSRDRIWNY